MQPFLIVTLHAEIYTYGFSRSFHGLLAFFFFFHLELFNIASSKTNSNSICLLLVDRVSKFPLHINLMYHRLVTLAYLLQEFFYCWWPFWMAVMSSVNKDSFNSYFHISVSFLSWFRLILGFWCNVGQEMREGHVQCIDEAILPSYYSVFFFYFSHFLFLVIPPLLSLLRGSPMLPTFPIRALNVLILVIVNPYWLILKPALLEFGPVACFVSCDCVFSLPSLWQLFIESQT